MVHRVWIDERRQAEFEEVFGPTGIRSVILLRADGYRKTELKCESGVSWAIRDYWRSHIEFEAFRDRFAAEYQQFSRRLLAEGLVERQEWLGSFYLNESDDDEALAPA